MTRVIDSLLLGGMVFLGLLAFGVAVMWFLLWL